MSVDPKKVKEILDKNILADGFDPVIDLEKSHGSWIVDQRNGNELLDMFSMYASGSVGYNHPKIVDSKDKLGTLAINKTTLSDIYNVYYAEFMETFSKYAVPSYLNNVFFIDGGSLAVENALKVAFDWKIRKNLSKGVENKGHKVLYFKEAFHGRSGYTLSLTNTDPVKTMYFPKFDWIKIDNPYMTYPETDELMAEVLKNEELAILQIKKALKDNADDIAALIIEPIQGEGGDNHFRCQFFQMLRDLADDNEFLLIYDEVQTGIGITGKMWAHENFTPKLCQCDPPIKKAPIPDIVSFGKKTQVCGILVGDRINEVKDNVFKKSSRINSTFGGNLVDMYRFKLILEIIEEESLLENSLKMGKYLLNSINDLSIEFPGYVTNPRGIGLFCAFDLPSTLERDKFTSLMLDKRVMILGSGTKSIRFRPHLNVLKSDLDFCMNAVHSSLKEMLN